MTNNNNITGKQVLNDCVTLVKHLGAYVVCVTIRVAGKVKSMLAERNKPQDDCTADKKTVENEAHGKASA